MNEEEYESDFVKFKRNCSILSLTVLVVGILYSLIRYLF